MASASSSSSSLSVSALEAALDVVLAHNFDADSKSTISTLIKILDNIVSKPADNKMRTLKLNNKAFQQQIVTRKGGIEFLLACGFAIVSDPPLLSRVQEERLVLINENTQHLMTARRLLHTRAVRDLKMDPNLLPPLKQPPIVMPTTSIYTQNSSDFSFNPYAGQRFDAKAYAAGVPSIKSDPSYKSPTEAKLLQLQQQKELLERQVNMQPISRDWMALRPGQAVPLSATADSEPLDTSNLFAKSSDSALIAQRLQQQQLAAQQRERFTTRAMRELKEMERKRVYSHATLTIQFNNGIRLMGRFLPSETVAEVKAAMAKDCFASVSEHPMEMDGDVAMGDASAPLQFDLFMTPPRRILDAARTLEQEGLVPAAKVFCTATQELRPHLFALHDVALPVGKAIVDSSVAASSGESTSSRKDQKDDHDKSLASREDALLQRMMGGNQKMGTTEKKSSSKKPK